MLLPRKIISFLLFCFCCPIYGQQLTLPVFSSPSGYYSDSIFVSITTPDIGVTIHYTLNGNEPTINSPVYSSPILMKSRSEQPNTFSMVPTNPSLNYPLPGYDTSRANSRGWLPPIGNVYKINVIKAKVFKVGKKTSKTAVATYIIDPLLYNKYSLPVLSVTTDSNNFFSDTTGIYVYGIDTASEGNYSVSGTERMVNLQLFSNDGNLLLSQYCGARNHGGGGRHAAQKALLLIARNQYDSNSFDLQLFSDKSTSHFKNFLLRNGGHRPDCYPRDDLAGQIVKHLDFEVQHTQHVIVFINGEYWGMQSIKDVFDDNYLSNKYHINKSDVTILELSGSIDDGFPGDDLHYLNMRNFAINNDMTIDNNYKYIKTQMDVDNYIDYISSEVYFGNGDWPNNNIKYWRYNRPYDPNAGVGRDGRWRWMLYDLDAGFSGDCIGIHLGYDALDAATSLTGGNSTRLLRALLVNQDFKNSFINRSADLLNTTFLPERVQTIENNLFSEITPEMTEHVNRWRYPSVATTLTARVLETPSLTKWNTLSSDLLDFANRRPERIFGQYMSYFSLSDTIDITVNVSDTLAGRVKFSTLIIDKNLVGLTGLPYPWKGKYFTNVPIPLKAIARPGYKFVNWLNTNIINPDTVVYPVTDTSFTAIFDIDTSFHALHYLYINELAANNRSGKVDEYSEHNDWFEIYNPHNYPVDIDNYYVTDTLGNKIKYKFESGRSKTIIPANGFLLLWADDQTEQGVHHTNFKLSSSGEELALILPDGKTVVDSVIFTDQIVDHSFGRQYDGDSTWMDFKTPTPGRSNYTEEIIDESIPLFSYPNPSRNMNRLFFNKPVNIIVTNSLGQLILTAENTMSIDIPGLQSGIYFIKTDKGEIVKWIKL